MDKTSEHLTISNSTFFIPHFAGKTKKEFIELYKNIADYDIDNAWERIQSRLKELGLHNVEKERPGTGKAYQEKLNASLNKKDVKHSDKSSLLTSDSDSE